MLLHFIKQIRAHRISFTELRFYFLWKKSLEPNASSVSDEQPWITYKTIQFLKDNINKGSRVFEYGGGGSTLFFIKKGCNVVTVEHNTEWFSILSKILSPKNVSNWTGKLITAQEGNLFTNPDIANPEHYTTEDKENLNKHFKNYASAIDEFKDGFFDLVVVDGRSRPACLKHSIPKIKSGGFLMLDNSDRSYYLTFFEKIISEKFDVIIDSFGSSPYSNQFTKTTVWRKK